MKDGALIPFGNKACGSKYYGGSIPGTGEGGVLLILAVEVRNGVTERGEERVFLLGVGGEVDENRQRRPCGGFRGER